MRFLRQSKKIEGAENPFWITYSDLLSSLVMIFLILIFVFMGLSSLQIRAQQEQMKENLILREKVEHLNIIEHVKSLKKLKEKLRLLKENKDFKKYVMIDEERSIVGLNNSILFQTNEYTLQQKGKDFLKKFMFYWGKNFLTEEFIGEKGLIEQVYIEGRTDTQGAEDKNRNYKDNLKLSQQRSEAVLNFIFDECDFPNKEKLKYKMSASGRSHIDCFLELRKQKLTWENMHTIDKESVQSFRSVNIKLIFFNPLLKWDSDIKDGVTLDNLIKPEKKQ